MQIGDLQLATDVQLETLPPGLYVACNEAGAPMERARMGWSVYDTKTDSFKNAGPEVLLARVREGGLLPNGVESVTIRADGAQIIKQWVAVHEFDFA